MQANSPLISIIIPTYNRANLIGETLDSIIVQSYINWECLVIDDGSSDDTALLLSHYVLKDSRIQYQKRPVSYLPGGNGARNYGFDLSKGIYIMWFDSDDLMLPEYLKLQLANCLSHNYEFSICKFTTFSKKAGVLVKESKLRQTQLLEDFITKKIKINPQSIIYHRPIVDEMRYDEGLCKAQDLDFIYRVLLQNRDAGGILDQVLVKVRIHDNRLTSNYKNFELDPLLSSIEVKWRIVRDCQKFIDDLTLKTVTDIFISELKLIAYRGNFITFISYLNGLFKIEAIGRRKYLAIAIKCLSMSTYKMPQGLFKRSKNLKRTKSFMSYNNRD